MLGETGAERGSEAVPKERGEGAVKVPLIPNLQQLSLYLTVYKDNILLSFQRLIFSAFFAALHWAERILIQTKQEEKCIANVFGRNKGGLICERV